MLMTMANPRNDDLIIAYHDRGHDRHHHQKQGQTLTLFDLASDDPSLKEGADEEVSYVYAKPLARI